jgi:hypothetical protein
LRDNNPESRARSALILSCLHNASESSIFTNIIAALKSPESIDNNSWRPDASLSTENKQWRLAAIESLRRLRDPASVGPLTEIAHAPAVDSASQTDSPEIKASTSAHKHGVALASKAQSGKASYDGLVEGLKYRESVGDPAWALGQSQNQNSLPLPAILDAVEKFKDKDAINLLRQIRPEALIEQLRQGRTEGVEEIAKVLALQKPPSPEGIAYLDQIIDRMMSTEWIWIPP